MLSTLYLFQQFCKHEKEISQCQKYLFDSKYLGKLVVLSHTSNLWGGEKKKEKENWLWIQRRLQKANVTMISIGVLELWQVQGVYKDGGKRQRTM